MRLTGSSSLHYGFEELVGMTEDKRAVDDKPLWASLVSTTEMTRCIHCTRCVRFMDRSIWSRMN